MSSELCVYVGVYIKVWMPLVITKDKVSRCSKCLHPGQYNFCPDCGAEIPTIERTTREDTREFVEDIFGREDVFFVREPEEVMGPNAGPALVMGNQSTQIGFRYIMGQDQFEIPPNEVRGDWLVLLSALKKAGIRHKECYGIVSYWN